LSTCIEGREESAAIMVLRGDAPDAQETHSRFQPAAWCVCAKIPRLRTPYEIVPLGTGFAGSHGRLGREVAKPIWPIGNIRAKIDHRVAQSGSGAGHRTAGQCRTGQDSRHGRCPQKLCRPGSRRRRRLSRSLRCVHARRTGPLGSRREGGRDKPE
jgi:hypothetical protein